MVLSLGCGFRREDSTGTERTPARFGEPAARSPATARAVPDASGGAADAPLPNGAVNPKDCDATEEPLDTSTRFAVIGDYGNDTAEEAAVAALVKGWKPEFVLTLGDNNYPSGAASTIDANIGQYFREFICPYRGSYGAGAKKNRFFPALGNHDWDSSTYADPYLDYFTLPGNERYYEVLWKHVHVFVIDSDPREPDGNTATSKQAAWLKSRLAASTAPFRLVTMHHPPFSSSSRHGDSEVMQWPYRAWGATLVLAGHDHTYERLMVDGLPYLVMGLGGAPRYEFGPASANTQFRYRDSHGALRLEATAERLIIEVFAIGNIKVDEFVLAAH